MRNMILAGLVVAATAMPTATFAQHPTPPPYPNGTNINLTRNPTASATGTITAVGNGFITVLANRKPLHLAVGPNTVIRSRSGVLTQDALQANETVTVRYDPSSLDKRLSEVNIISGYNKVSMPSPAPPTFAPPSPPM